jgi:hypothetical protein
MRVAGMKDLARNGIHWPGVVVIQGASIGVLGV